MIEKINSIVAKAAKEAELKAEAAESDRGHYSTSIAFILAKKRGRNPFETAQELASKIAAQAPVGFFEKVEAVSPGFVNFWLSPETLQNELKEILNKREKYGQFKFQTPDSKFQINIEFISANPTGQLTIGNGRGGFFGDVLGNILKFAGHKVTKEYYVNDAKASTQIKELGKTAVGEGAAYLSNSLRLKIKNKKSKIKNTIQKLKNKEKEIIYGEVGYLLAQEIQKDNKKFIEKGLKIKFDKWFNEENLYKSGAVDKLLAELKNKELVYGKDEALWLKTKGFGDSEDRVLVRRPRQAGQAGEPTYFLPDLAYHLNKFKVRRFDKIIDVWGADHHGYEPRLRAGLKALGIFENGDGKFKVIITQLARLIKDGKEVKMSKRKGEFITLEDLIKEAGLDAAKFFFLMSTPDTHMNFDLSLAKERSMKNPVYYAQYAAVRCGSILRKAQSAKRKEPTKLELLSTPEDVNLMRQLARFPEIVKEAAGKYNPQILVRYLLDLARQFHNFYEKERVIGETPALATARLALIKATQIVLKNILNLLGVSLPKKM